LNTCSRFRDHARRPVRGPRIPAGVIASVGVAAPSSVKSDQTERR
jgi:hypothetical protein